MTLAILQVTNGAVVDASGTNYVIAATGTDLIATYVQQAIAAGQTAQEVLDAILAAGLSEGVFPSEAAGLSGTTDGQYFWVGSGGTVTLYLNDSGTGDEIAELATMGAFAAPTGAQLVAWKRADSAYASIRTLATEQADAVRFTQFYDPMIGPAGLGDALADTAAFERAVLYAMANGRALAIPDNATPFRFNSIDFPVNQIGVDGDTARPTRLLICGTGQVEYVGADPFMFDCSAGYFYDLVVDGPRFLSTPGNGAAAFNGDKFIRLVIAPGVQFEKFDYVVYAATYIQSIKMFGAICRGGEQAFVKAPQAYDCSFIGNIMEFGIDGIVIDSPSADPAVHTCQIVSNVIEGMTGRGIVTGACLATMITGNYMEGNLGGEVFLDEGISPHNGLIVSGNSFQQRAERLAANAYSVVWGASLALSARAGGNFCTGHLHDLTGAAGILDTFGDVVVPGKNITTPDVGRSITTDGLSLITRWFMRHVRLDPYFNEVTLGGKHDSGGTSPCITFGTANPEGSPGLYERTTWAKGSVVFNVDPASADAGYWVCLTAGTPGTWSFVGIVA